MRSPVEFCLTEIDSYSNMLSKIEQILESSLLFEFDLYEIVHQFSNEAGEEDWLVKFPDITSLEPVLWGDTVFVCGNNKTVITDPSWKHILNLINTAAKEQPNFLFKTLDIIGITEDGMSYVVEVVVK